MPIAIMPTERRRSSIVGRTQKTKPTISITLNDQQEEGLVPAYTTLDKIEGAVSITAPVNLSFDDIHITFQGSTRSYVEKVANTAAAASRSQAYHNFLRLAQPIDESVIPPNRVAEAGTTYTFPFTFVVPERLLPQSCTHSKDADSVHEAHLQLPPSLGDPMMSGDGKSLLDDLTPDMAVISYAIRVIVIRRNPENPRKPIVIVDSVKKLRIIPAVAEAAPIRVSGTKDDEYTLRKEKVLKKGMFKGKLGRLTMEAAQPKSLRLAPLGSNVSDVPITTMAVINLRFDPCDANSKPPRLGHLCSKLKASTFYACVPLRDFPTKTNAYLYDNQRGIHVESINLSSRNIESAQWTTHTVRERHDSGISISDDFTPVAASQLFYTCQILVPVDLPTSSKTFVPSFHSCLVSRVYSLDLVLSVHGPSNSVSSPSMHLKVPLQISAEPNPNARPVISEEEMRAINGRRLDAYLEPRSTAPPSPEYTEVATLFPSNSANANLPPSPRYSVLAPVSSTTNPSTIVGRESEPSSPEYTELARGGVGIMESMMRDRRQGDLEALREQLLGDAREAPPGYSAPGGRATSVRARWDHSRRIRLSALGTLAR